jgi:epoxyqueuosine reductase
MTHPIPKMTAIPYREWLEKGMHGEMQYLERHLPKKEDIFLIHPTVKTVISLGYYYYTSYEQEQTYKGTIGKISKYAWGTDYHEVIWEKMKSLTVYLKTLDPESENIYYCDTGPIFEKEYARLSGLGWIGKNTLLINQKFGSYVFLAEILTSVEFSDEQKLDTDHCGSCQRCIDACPTDALTPYKLDARKCIAYLTIEKKSSLTKNEQKMVGEHVFGCDICQDVCPWNNKMTNKINESLLNSSKETFHAQKELSQPILEELIQIDPEEFKIKFKDSPIKRSKYIGFLRNVIVAMKNTQNPNSLDPNKQKMLQEISERYPELKNYI